MPKIKDAVKWECVHCNKVWDTEDEAKKCERSHDYIFVKMTRLELKKLIEFIYTGNARVLPKELIDRMYKLDRLVIER